jgi:hypothetical protein
MNISLAGLEINIYGINRVKLEMDGNDVPSMSHIPKINAEQATKKARNYLNETGYGYYFIEQVKHEGGNWRVRATTMANKLVVTISDTGEIIELEPIDG